MALNPSIILGGQQFDLAGAMQTGLDMAARQKQFDQQNALASLYQTQGANIMAGDQNALNALAQYDPAAALGIQSQRQTMAYQTEDQNNQRETARREAEKYAKTISAEQAAAEAAEIERGVKAALAAPTPEAYDAMVTQMGRPELVGTFDDRQALATDYMTVAEVLKMTAPPAKPEPTASQRDYQFYTDQETAAGRAPLSFNEWDLQSRKAGATNVTVGGGPAPDDVAAFNKGVKSANVNEVIGDIRNTITGATLPTTGMVGSALSGVGGTAAGDVKSNVETLKAAASFSSLQAMRDASKTGAALGAVSDTEIKLLSAELANLEQSQSQEQFLRNLDRFERVYNEIVNGPATANRTDDGTGIGTIEDGFRYIGGDASTPEAWEPVQ